MCEYVTEEINKVTVVVVAMNTTAIYQSRRVENPGKTSMFIWIGSELRTGLDIHTLIFVKALYSLII